VRESDGFSLNEMRCAIYAKVRVWNLPVLLMTIGIIITGSLLLICLVRTCFNGSYMLCVLLTVSRVFKSVDFLHSISCRHLLSLYVLCSIRCPLAFRLYHMDLMMSGLWCCGFFLVGFKLGLYLCDVVLLCHLAILFVLALGLAG